jgi:hypothetical protein
MKNPLKRLVTRACRTHLLRGLHAFRSIIVPRSEQSLCITAEWTTTANPDPIGAGRRPDVDVLELAAAADSNPIVGRDFALRDNRQSGRESKVGGLLEGLAVMCGVALHKGIRVPFHGNEAWALSSSRAEMGWKRKILL